MRDTPIMAELPPFDPYTVLGVDKLADSTEIKKAYRKLALIKHPDKCTDESLRQSRTDEFQQLNEAYAILADDDTRKRHDALVKLDALRKQKASMGGPRTFSRSATFSSGYSTGADSYPFREANIEDRAPRKQYFEDDMPGYSRRYADYDYERRPQPKSPRERTKEDREADERRRGDRRRDNGIREARSRKYDYADEKFSPYDDERRRRDRDDRDRPEEPIEKLRSKYADMEDMARGYTGVGGSIRTKPVMETRPSMGRRSSTRDVPPAFVRRSSAVPKESGRSQRDLDLDAEILERERRKLRELQAEQELRRMERERREGGRDYDFDRVRPREKDASRSRKENVEPFEKRPPNLQHTNSAPPFVRDDDFSKERMHRTKTEPPVSKAHTPSMPRSNTMPSVSAQLPPKPTRQSSKLRESHIPDTGYSSNSTNDASDYKPSRSSKPVQVKTYKYSRESSDEKIPTIPERTSRRTRSPSPKRSDRPSATAAKLAGLAKQVKTVNMATRRPSVKSSSSSTRSIPLRSARSPERRREKDRDRDYARDSRDSQLYGERTPQPREYARNVSYSKPIRDEDIIYSDRPSPRRERHRESSYGFPPPSYHRTNSIPISSMSQ